MKLRTSGAMTLARLRAFVFAILAAFVLSGTPTATLYAAAPTAERGASRADQKTVHVKAHKKKDGTIVSAHERKAPKSKGEPASSTTSATKTRSAPAVRHARTRCENCDRDAHGRIVRSQDAKQAFKTATGFPHGRPGFVIDHIVQLACHGANLPSNMQWQTKDEAKAKDKSERIGCGR